MTPSAEQATDRQFPLGAVVADQVTPEFVETKIGSQLLSLPAAANTFVPSAEDATQVQFVLGALASVQVAPESRE